MDSTADSTTASTATVKSAPDFEPPPAVITRIIKSACPNTSMTKDARSAFVRAAGIFIFYITHCANDFCKESGRSTINATDIKNAMKELDFDELAEPLESFMVAYRREQAKISKAAKDKKEQNALTTTEEEDNDEENADVDEMET
jgi:DNA polymerase epsilon subunit 3